MRQTLLLMLLLCFGASAYAQLMVRGRVTIKEDDAGLPGVTVLVKGTSVGTITDINGAYTLEIPANTTNPMLVFSFIGFNTQEVAVNNRSTIDVELGEDVDLLQEVVVVGYGTQDKKVVTGATVAVKSEDIAKTNSLRVEQALQGQTPGVQITSTSGQPGEALKVRIRGTGTLGNSDPLYVVDGVPTGDISYLSPSSIERVDVLKDAASAAIYGARAANGVVLITTKQGREGKMQLSLDSYYGVQNFYKKLPMLNAQQYAVIMNEANINSGQLPVYSLQEIENMGEGTDWMEEVINDNAPIQDHSLTLSGGNERSTFSTSLSYFEQEGIIGGDQDKSSFNRVSFRINSDHKAYRDIIRIGQNLTYSHVNRKGLRVGGLYNNSLRGLFNTSPVFSVYDEEGNFSLSPISPHQETNPIGAMYYSDFNRTMLDRLVGNIYTEVQPIKGLIFRSDFGADLSLNNYRAFDPEYKLHDNAFNTISSATQSAGRNITWNWDNTLRYEATMGKNYFNVLVGMAAQSNDGNFLSATKQGLTFDDFEHAVLNNGTIDTTVVATGGRTEYALLSQFGRLNYNYNEKYLFTATVRRDGSSNFGPNNRWGVFPSVSVGWVLSEEMFLKRIPALNFMKLRASWGQNGNDRLRSFAYLATVDSRWREYYFGSGELKYIGTSPDKLPNPNLKWETSEQINLGFDATFLRNISFSMDYYQKITKDWLVVAPVPDLVGTSAPWVNGGTIENKGIELQLGYQQSIGDLSFSINANAAFNKNEVAAIDNSEGIIHGSSNIIWQGLGEVNRAEVGLPVGYFWGYEVAGIFQNEAQVQAYRNNEKVVQPGALPGDVIFVDRNRDGMINDLDKTNIGDPNPDVTYGFNINMDYKGFDLAVYTYGMAGHQNILGTRSHERWFNNYTTDILGRWHGEGTSNSVPRVTLGDEENGNYRNFSELYIEDASFFRIKTISLGYDFNKLLKNSPFQQLRFYVGANNLFTFTAYRGMDPEVGFGTDASPQPGVSYQLSAGMDIGYYPQPRTYLTGLNIKF